MKEYKRTCKRDGTVWYVPKELRKLPRKPGFSDKLRAGGGALSGNAAETTRLGNMQSAYDRALDAQRCPTCGSRQFEEAKA